MIFLRSLIFNIYFPVWTGLVALLGSPLLLTPPHIAAKIGRVWSNGVLLGLRVICNIKYEIRGMEKIPAEPFLIACKHQSAWDTVIFLKILNSPSYILKKELLKIPVFGSHLISMGMIAIDRSGGGSALKKVNKDVNDRVVEQKRSVVIFPEGTRTTPGTTNKYQPGIALIYKDLDQNVPVIPVALNSGKFWGRNSFTKQPGTIILEFLPEIKKGMDRKEFLTLLQKVIDERSEEI